MPTQIFETITVAMDRPNERGDAGRRTYGPGYGLLASMMANASVALRRAINPVNHGADSSLAAACAIEADLFALPAATADRAKGSSAFLAKRKPVFHAA